MFQTNVGNAVMEKVIEITKAFQAFEERMKKADISRYFFLHPWHSRRVVFFHL